MGRYVLKQCIFGCRRTRQNSKVLAFWVKSLELLSKFSTLSWASQPMLMGETCQEEENLASLGPITIQHSWCFTRY